MKKAFADSAFYVAVANPADALHRKAVTAGDAVQRITTTEYVLTEVANFFSRPAWRARFIGLLLRLRADPNTTLVPASPDLFARGFDLFTARPDKGWSLTDCTSFVVMGRDGLTDALTGDHHFAQAGFVALLAPPSV